MEKYEAIKKRAHEFSEDTTPECAEAYAMFEYLVAKSADHGGDIWHSFLEEALNETIMDYFGNTH